MKCCICNIDIEATHSHNAEPVKKGRCCCDCNTKVVIPARLERMRGMIK